MNKIIPVLLLGVICILFYLRCDEIKFVQDDAYTSFRYVNNFLDGKGLVFNVGENVEGYTNFLWVMILALLLSISRIINIDINLITCAQFLSILFGILILIFNYTFTKKLLSKYSTAENKFQKIIFMLMPLLPPIFLLNSAPMIYWSVSGMETTLFVLLTLISIHRFLFYRNKSKVDWIFVIVSILNSLTRPEGLLVFLLLIVFSLNTKRREFGSFNIFRYLQKDKKLYQEIVFYLIPLALYFVFRLIYYGYPLPNTFYAKTGFNYESFVRGVNYIVEGIFNNFVYGIFLVIPIISLRINSIKQIALFHNFFVFIYLIFVMIIGGDVLPIDRFFLPIIPLVFSFIALLIFQITELTIKLHKRIILLLIVIAISLSYSFHNYKNKEKEIYSKRAYELGLVQKMKIYGNWIRERLEGKRILSNENSVNKNSSVALSTIGAFSFYSNSTVIDIVGLTNEFIAHNPKEVDGIDVELPVLWKERRYNAEYVLSRKPDYIIFPAGAKPTAFAECALFVQKNFYKNYYCQLLYSEELKQMLPIFTRRTQQLEIKKKSCNVKFVKPFIEANNLFLNLLSSRNFTLLGEIIVKADESISLCEERKSDLEALKGYAYFHSGKLELAKINFENSLRSDSLNMISRFYLLKIYSQVYDTSKMIEQIKFLKKYSPSALPSLQ